MAFVQHLTVTIGANESSEAVALSEPVPVGQSWLIGSFRGGANNRNDQSLARWSLTDIVGGDYTTVTAQRHASGTEEIVVELSVVSGDEFTVQSGTTTLSGATSITVPIDTVDESKTFVAFSFTGDSTTAVAARAFLRADIPQSDELRFRKGSTTDGATASWFIVEWEGAAVQAHTVAVSNTESSGTVAITAVDLDKAFLLHSNLSAAANLNGNNEWFRTSFDSATTIRVDREGTTGTRAGTVFVVEHPSLRVQSGNVTQNSPDVITDQGIADVALNKTFPARATRFGNAKTTNTGSEVARQTMTHPLTDVDNLRIQRTSGTAGNNTVTFFVVEILVELSGKVDATSTVSGALSVDRKIAATTQGQSAVDGALSVDRSLSGASAATSEITGTGTLFSPADLDGLFMWFDAETVSAADGERIALWPDESGAGRDLLQPAASDRPTYRTSSAAFNGRPVVSFFDHSTRDFMDTAAFASALPQPNTFFVVWRTDPAAITQTVMDTPSGGRRIADIGSSLQTHRIFSGSFLSTSVTQSTNVRVSMFLYNGATSRIRQDGDDLITGNAGTQSMGAYRIGNRQNNVEPFQGEIAEVVAYDRVLTTDEIDQVETYLGAKYGVPIAEDVLFQGTVAAQSDVSGALSVDRKLAGEMDVDATIHGNVTVEAAEIDLAGTISGSSDLTAELFEALGVFVFDGVSMPFALSSNEEGTQLIIHAPSSVAYDKTIPFDFLVNTLVYNQTDSQIRENSELEVQGNVGENAFTGLTIGANIDDEHLATMDIAEIIVHNRLLSSTEMRRLELYAGQKYGLIRCIEANLTLDFVVAGALNSQSMVVASLDTTRHVSGSIDSTSDLSGEVRATRHLEAAIAADGDVDANLSVSFDLFAQVDAVSDVSGRLIEAMAGTIEASATISGQLSIDMVFHASIAPQSQLTAQLGLDLPIAGDVHAVSALDALLSVIRGMAGDIAGTSDLTAALTPERNLFGAIEGQSDLEAILQPIRRLSASIDATSELTARIDLILGLRAEIDSTSDLEAFLRADRLLATLIEAQSETEANLIVDYELRAEVDAAAFLRASFLEELFGSIEAASEITATLSGDFFLFGRIRPESEFAADAIRVRNITGHIPSAAMLDGVLSRDMRLVASIDATATLESRLSRALGLATQVIAVSDLTADVLVDVAALFGDIHGQSELTGDLVVAIPIKPSIARSVRVKSRIARTVVP
jgi:hypothetical protein